MYVHVQSTTECNATLVFGLDLHTSSSNCEADGTGSQGRRHTSGVLYVPAATASWKPDRYCIDNNAVSNERGGG